MIFLHLLTIWSGIIIPFLCCRDWGQEAAPKSKVFVVGTHLDYFSMCIAAVSCSSNGYRLGGVKMWSGTTGKLSRAWHRCMGGAWVPGSLVA